MTNNNSKEKEIHKESSGFLYCSFSENYVDEAVSSIKTLLKHNLNANICLVTTKILKKYLHSTYPDLVIDKIICVVPEIKPNCFFRTKLNEYTPYKKTIALDTDTYILDNISNLFDILDTFDLAMVPDEALPARSTIIGLKGGYSALGYYNCGFIAFRKSNKTDILFKTWGKEFLDFEELEPADQGPLIRALVNTDLRFITLPKEYNTRLFSKCTSIHGKVKIIHGRAKNPEKLINKINNFDLVSNGSRVWIPNLQTFIFARNYEWYAKILTIFGLVNVFIGAFGGLDKVVNNKHIFVLKILNKVKLIFKSIISFFKNLFKKDSISPFSSNYIDFQSLKILNSKSNKQKNEKINSSISNNHKFNVNTNFIDLIKSENLKSIISLGKDGLDLLHVLNNKLDNSVSISYCNNNLIHKNTENKFYTNSLLLRYDLVYCGQIPDPTRYKKVFKELCSICNKYIVISFDLPLNLIKSNSHPRPSLDYDYCIVQWVCEEGFYFDPALTIKLRKTATDDYFKYTGLIFKKYIR